MNFSTDVLKYEDIREQIISILNDKSEFSGQFDFANSNIGYFIDIMSYVAMNLNYNISNVANNMFLDSTDIRKNAVSLAKVIGYTPRRPIPAKFSGTLYYNDTNLTLTEYININSKSLFYGNLGNIYTNLDNIKLVYKGNPTQLQANYVLYQGSFKYFEILPDGNENFAFIISNPKISDTSTEFFNLYVIPTNQTYKLSNGGYDLSTMLPYKWTKIKTFDEIVNRNVYYVDEDIIDEGNLKITFGNGIIGNIPSTDYVIVCEYFETEGNLANNELLTSLPTTDKLGNIYINYTMELIAHTFAVGNFDGFQTKSYGGTTLESIDSIKSSAPKFFSTTSIATTYNSYKYLLISKFPSINTVNIVSGDELYPEDYTKLGNIYISVIPNITFDDFLYNNQIYISPSDEFLVTNYLNTNSIISTKKHLFKPTYIIVDVTPLIEFGKELTIAEQTNIKTVVVSNLTNYFLTNFNDLGIKFRESKVESVIDSITSLTSSAVNLKFYFAINNNTVQDIIAGVNDIMFLPTINVYDKNNNVTGKTRFIKTLTDVIRDTKQTPSYWGILDSNYDLLPTDETSILNKTLYSARMNEMNSNIMNMQISESSIYSDVPLSTTSNINRRLYNKDMILTPMSSLNVNVGSVTANTKQFTTFDNKIVDIKIASTDIIEVYELRYSDFDTSYPIGYIKKTNNNIEIYNYPNDILRATAIENLLRIGITTAQYIYKDSIGNPTPFTLIKDKNSTNIYDLNVNVISNISQITINSTNKICDISSTIIGTFTTSNFNKGWIASDLIDNYSTLTYTTSTVPSVTAINIIEQSHIGYNTKFKGYIGTNTYLQLDKLSSTIFLNTLTDNNIGDYYIILDYTVYNGEVYLPNDVWFINKNDNTMEFKKATIKKEISSFDNAAIVLNTNYINNTIYTSDTVELYSNDNNLGFVPVVLNSNVSLDSDQEPPTKLVDNRIVKVLNPNGVATQIVYPDGGSKIGTLQRRNDLEGDVGAGWETLSDRTLYDGDLIIYNQTNLTWDLIANIDTGNATSTYYRTIIENNNKAMIETFTVSASGVKIYPLAYTPTAITTNNHPMVYLNGALQHLSIEGETHDYHIDSSDITNIVFESGVVININFVITVTYTRTDITSVIIEVPTGRIQYEIPILATLSAITNIPYKHQIYKMGFTTSISDYTTNTFVNYNGDVLANTYIINEGEFIICTNVNSKIWTVFDDDFYDYTVDIINENSKFPIDVSVGNKIQVVSGAGNFGGYFIDNIALNDFLVYCNNDVWIKYVTIAKPSDTAVVGDLVVVNDVGGTLTDNTSISCPTYTGFGKIFNYNDILYFDSVKWVKIHPINIYSNPIPTDITSKLVLNTNNINSDLIVKIISSSSTEYQVEIDFVDVYNNQCIADLNYENGEMIFRTSLDKQLNRNLIQIGIGTLSDIFDANNYSSNVDSKQSDLIRMIPITSNGTQVNDFDTTFNQYIIGNINPVVNK